MEAFDGSVADWPDVQDGIGNNVTESRLLYLRTFLQLVAPNSQLYATKGYSKAGDKFLTWNSVGEAMEPELTAAEAEKLFHRLREKFGKERNKILKAMPRSGAGAGPLPTSPWILYNDLLFLADHIQSRPRPSAILPGRASPSPSSTSTLSTPAVQSSSPSPGPSRPTTPTSSCVWNQELMTLLSPTGSSDSSDVPNMSVGSPESISSLMAIRPTKTVSVTDPVKKRKREPDGLNDAVVNSSKSTDRMSTALSSALDRLGQPQAATPPAPAPGVSPVVQGLMASIAAGLGRVPEANQLSCVIQVLQVVEKFVNDGESNS